jgi:hypothetical protein
MPTCLEGPAVAVKGAQERGDVLGEVCIWLVKGKQWISARDKAPDCCREAECRGCEGWRLSQLQ